MYGENLTVLDQFGPKFAHHLQRLQIVTANLAGYIAGPAHCALENCIHNFVCIIDLFEDKRLANGISAPRGVCVEIVISYAWTPVGKTMALYLV